MSPTSVDSDAAGALIELVSPEPVMEREERVEQEEQEAVTILRGLASGAVQPETSPPRIVLAGEAVNTNVLQHIPLSGG